MKNQILTSLLLPLLLISLSNMQAQVHPKPQALNQLLSAPNMQAQAQDLKAGQPHPLPQAQPHPKPQALNQLLSAPNMQA
ncbi:MAG TPA: hypothetical protein PLM86_06650, partial [Bacteroidales bacterium]|nr:hypothetical protein [Bacteroidales bacterium]HQN82588.1 hypothetical protein [Bacteroidales bacterium]